MGVPFPMTKCSTRPQPPFRTASFCRLALCRSMRCWRSPGNFPLTSELSSWSYALATHNVCRLRQWLKTKVFYMFVLPVTTCGSDTCSFTPGFLKRLKKRITAQELSERSERAVASAAEALEATRFLYLTIHYLWGSDKGNASDANSPDDDDNDIIFSSKNDTYVNKNLGNLNITK